MVPIIVMKTGVSAVPSGGNVPGWISGDPASLAASASVTAIFDLGPDWQQYTVAAVCVYPVGSSSGFSNVFITSSATTSADNSRRPNFISSTSYASAFSASLTTANGGSTAHIRPQGRFLTVALTNADAVNPMGAAASVTVTIYPA